MHSFKKFLVETSDGASSDLHSNVPGLSIHHEQFLGHLSSPCHDHSDDTVSEASHTLSIGHKNMLLPKSSKMIEQGNAELPEGNLHKRIASGMKSAFAEMGNETPEVTKAKAKESFAHFKGFAQSRGLKGRPDLLGENGKTIKSTGEGVHTKGLILAPHSTNGLSGFDVCPNASSECRKNCLGTEAGGNRQYPDTAMSSKILRTHYMALHPEHTARILDHEIGAHVKTATKKGYKPGVRLNVTSDFNWEHMARPLFDRHPDAQFYDYTKMANRVGHPDLPANYHLTLSHTGTGHAESNDKQVAAKLAGGHVAAMIYSQPKKMALPTHAEDVQTGMRYPIVNGDHDDNTFDRHAQAGKTPGKAGHGVVSGLKLKGVTAASAGHFVNKVDDDRILRFNHPKQD